MVTQPHPMLMAAAKAIAQVHHNGRVADDAYWTTLATGSFVHIQAAIAALRAVRELTEDAVEVAYTVVVPGADLHDFCAHDCAPVIHTAIIDHILGEG